MGTGRTQHSLFQYQYLQSSLADLKTCVNPCSHIPMGVVIILNAFILIILELSLFHSCII